MWMTIFADQLFFKGHRSLLSHWVLSIILLFPGKVVDERSSKQMSIVLNRLCPLTRSLSSQCIETWEWPEWLWGKLMRWINDLHFVLPFLVCIKSLYQVPIVSFSSSLFPGKPRPSIEPFFYLMPVTHWPLYHWGLAVRLPSFTSQLLASDHRTFSSPCPARLLLHFSSLTLPHLQWDSATINNSLSRSF